jgi:hypothetical protein
MEKAEFIDLGTVEKLTEGIKDLLTDNHNGTWRRIPGDAPDDADEPKIAPDILEY